MKHITVSRRTGEWKKLVKKPVKLSADDLDVVSPAAITVDGKIEVVVLNCEKDTSEIDWAVRQVPMHEGRRPNGLAVNSRIFGFRPRLGGRELTCMCSAVSMAVDHPTAHKVLCDWAQTIEKMAEESFSERYKTQKEFLTEKVLPQWRVHSGVFTSGIVNRTSQLRYHYDAGNVPGGFSAMIVLKNNIQGGGLHIPELGVHVQFRTGDVIFFDGQSFLHGVSPIKVLNKSSHRHSVVYYALEQMQKCGTIPEEVEYARGIKTAIARKRAGVKISS